MANDTHTEAGEPSTEDTAEFTANVSLRIDELRRLLNESAPDLTDAQREHLEQILSEREKELKEYVDDQISQHLGEYDHDDRGGDGDMPNHTHPPGLTEERVIELIGEHAPEGGGGGDVGEDLRKRLEAMLARLDASLRELETSLSRVVGPSPEELTGKYHSTIGWGVHFEVDYPIRLLQATVIANQSGYTNVEVQKYDPVERTPLGLADSALIGIPEAGEHTIDLDLVVDEPGHYVLTRDYTDSPGDEDRVALRRTDTDYTGWVADSAEGATFHGGVDVEGRWGGNQLWYYFGDLHIRDNIPDVDGGGGGSDGSIREATGFGEGEYGEGPYGDGDENDRPTFGQ